MSFRGQAHERDDAPLQPQSRQPDALSFEADTTKPHPAPIVRRAFLAPASLDPGDVRRLQRHVGNRATSGLLVGPSPRRTPAHPALVTPPGTATIQRAGGKIDPGADLPTIEALAKQRFSGLFDKNAAPAIAAGAAAREVADAQRHVKDRMFMLDVFGRVTRVRQNANLPVPLLSDLDEMETIIESTLDGVDDLETAKNTAESLVENPVKRGRQNLVITFFRTTKAYSREQAELNPGSSWSDLTYLDPGTKATAENVTNAFLEARKDVTMRVKPLTPEEKRAFAAALKKMPTIQYLLEKHEAKQTPISVAQWKNGGFLSDTIAESKLNSEEPPTEGTANPRTNVDNGKFKQRVDEADQFIRTFVEPQLLADIPRPAIVVHLKYSGGLHMSKNTFRAYQSGNEVHVAQDEETSVIVHEVGHYLEDNLPSELWHDIHLMMRARHQASVDESGKDPAKAGHGSLGMREEGRYRGEYAATGKYTSSAYGGTGSTEVTSMTLEFLSDRDRVLKMIEKDPQQTAIVLRGLRPNEYAQTAELRAFDQYLPH